jgi:Methyltransferase domain
VASDFCERMIVGDVEKVDFADAFREQRFHVITFGDVLEHLIDPVGVLVRAKGVLHPNGCVVASVPNIGHSSIRLALLRGRFEYTDKGLLDRTHLRFFTAESLAGLFEDAGYEVRTWRRIILDPFATEVDVREEDYPSWLAQAARGDPHGITFQFVVRAYPLKTRANGRRSSSPPKAPGTNLVDELWRWDDEQRSVIRLTQEALDATRNSLDQTNAMVLERDALLAERDRSLREAQAQLVEITQSLGYRLLQAYRKRVRRLFPQDSSRGAPYRSVRAFAKRAGRAVKGNRSQRDVLKDGDGRPDSKP